MRLAASRGSAVRPHPQGVVEMAVAFGDSVAAASHAESAGRGDVA